MVVVNLFDKARPFTWFVRSSLASTKYFICPTPISIETRSTIHLKCMVSGYVNCNSSQWRMFECTCQLSHVDTKFSTSLHMLDHQYFSFSFSNVVYIPLWPMDSRGIQTSSLFGPLSSPLLIVASLSFSLGAARGILPSESTSKLSSSFVKPPTSSTKHPPSLFSRIYRLVTIPHHTHSRWRHWGLVCLCLPSTVGFALLCRCLFLKLVLPPATLLTSSPPLCVPVPIWNFSLFSVSYTRVQPHEHNADSESKCGRTHAPKKLRTSLCVSHYSRIFWIAFTFSGEGFHRMVHKDVPLLASCIGQMPIFLQRMMLVDWLRW